MARGPQRRHPRRRVYNALTAAGIGHKREGERPITFHDLRHTFGIPRRQDRPGTYQGFGAAWASPTSQPRWTTPTTSQDRGRASDTEAVGQEPPEEISAEFARQWWKTLMTNAVALVEDAAVLAEHQSPGRAQALVVLAMEELAKARWLYEGAEWEWSAPLGLYGTDPRPAASITVPEGLRTTRRPHAEKIKVAERFASGLAGFWDSARRHEYYSLPDLETFEATARQRNLDKQAGFYVDRSGTSITSPLHVPSDEIEGDIQRAAQVIQMHMIEYHTRQQDAPDGSLIDSAEGLHWAVMRYAQP